jgi:hypothetical protein
MFLHSINDRLTLDSFDCRAAMHIWGKRQLVEILNVDKSREMNQLSQLILCGGQENKSPILPGVIYRQFMPHGREVSRFSSRMM